MKAETNRMLLKLSKLDCEAHTHQEIIEIYSYFYKNNLLNLLEYRHRNIIYVLIDKGILK